MVEIWKDWCRLCGRPNKLTADQIVKNENDNYLKNIISQYFVLSMEDERMPQTLCLDCRNFLTALSNFGQQVQNLQLMYLEMDHEEKLGNKIDLNSFRTKFGLDEIVEMNCKTKPELSKSKENESVDILDNDFDQVLGNENWINHHEMMTSSLIKMENFNEDALISNHIEKKKETKKLIRVDTIQCEICPKVFAQISRYLLHLKKKHNIIREPPPKNRQKSADDKIICKLCGKSCGNRGAYVSHMQKKHENAEIEEPKLYECSICSKTFTQKMALTKHEEIHLPKDQRNLFPCTQCNKKFLNEYLLEAHIKIVHLKERPFVCEVCGKGTTSKRSLEDHKLVHTEATHKCELCSQLFKNIKRLKVHMKTHENFNVPCLICNLRLKNNQSLKEHMSIHTDVKNFKCPLCENAFRCRRNLRAHMLTHTGLKPYHCSFCDVSYANRSNCKKHEKHAHPAEFAEMEAKGLKVHSKNVPKFHELKQMMEHMKQKIL
ncbi:zinc finger imprinted 3-like [Condylostylus longicornis]|uniref:zinc finger imprinted 3-like n=1 Tax=Condylostylus longicornis TaxID=2530218 RepID=UPI00244E4904|nr:zinc finger imprinted 3-like [Condylostylus longicornis]